MSDVSRSDSAFRVSRPHRADALRNFDALLAAARESLAEGGPTVPLEDIAQRAGVAIGTLYRNFPTRQHLYHAVFAEEVERLCEFAAQVADLPAWPAFEAWSRRFIGYDATKQAIQGTLDRNSEIFRAGREALRAAGEPLFRRAQEAGAIRPDARLEDAIRLVVSVAAGSFADDAQRERVLCLAFDGIRGAGRDADGPEDALGSPSGANAR
ncbi:TetR/AcrR family transcriptional regulator [Streptomyces sp. NBC_01217]|uniref:TetR/AcrR family transcriptional regulator n=1 Tax=Streptomyces sp. NBC_01217 TaxID=2903779 RepID=UPI002E1301D8|nr:TetR/AcrR family transcriptional regulator [Streptomyces sp. NBC_01217]WSQ62557.1 TetR/AcrR family transcriptional regulator [Streptomyces sp. NBC_01217]